MKTAIAAPPNDDERRRFLSALNALLHKRLEAEVLFFGIYTRWAAEERQLYQRRLKSSLLEDENP